MIHRICLWALAAWTVAHLASFAWMAAETVKAGPDNTLFLAAFAAGAVANVLTWAALGIPLALVAFFARRRRPAPRLPARREPTF